MTDKFGFIHRLFEARQIKISEVNKKLLNEFIETEDVRNAVNLIWTTQNSIMEKWKIWAKVEEIRRQNFSIPNGFVGKPYEANIDFYKNGWDDIGDHEIEGLEELGLNYDRITGLVVGIPLKSGDLNFILKFKLSGESESSPFHEKKIALIVNPDPRQLWKDLPVDQKARFQKQDTAKGRGQLGEKQIVVASKRGRSHANTGAFREDDFKFYFDEATRWSIVVVADGAGSAKFSREGSRLACDVVVEYFKENFIHLSDDQFETTESQETADTEINKLVYEHLSAAASITHQQLSQAASNTNSDLKDFHTTLSFALFKKIGSRYAILSFGVGDSPMAIVKPDVENVVLLNTLDVGEYGGGTRFITMPEIIEQTTFKNRFQFTWVPDFAYLFLMTDGIYDPKFSVEAAMEDINNWKNLLADLKGNNEAGTIVDFDYNNSEIDAQLLTWLDFWSPGNHDDRTLAIVF